MEIILTIKLLTKNKWAKARLKKIINKMCLQIIYLIYMNKKGFGIKNLQCLI